MPRQFPPLTALRTFESAAKWESFAKAANELCVSQSAVSQQIRVLEDWFDIQLFDRLGNRVALTDEGRVLGHRLNEAFEIIDEACARTTRYKETGVVHVSAEAAFASRWLRPRLAAFREAHPDIDVYLKVGVEPGSTGSDSADIAIHFETRLNAATHETGRLFPVDGYPACSPGFLDVHSGIETPADICDLPLIHDNSRMIWRRWFDRFVPGSEAWKTGYVYTDLSLAIDAAIDGEGVFLADDIICAHEISSGALVKASPETLRCAWYCMAVHRERANLRSVQAFRDWLHETSGWQAAG